MMKKCLSVILMLALIVGVVSAAPFTVSAEDVDVADTSAGTFTAWFKSGDTDLDGEISLLDVTMLQYNLSNMRTTFDDSVIENVGDVDRNDDLDITDATWIQRVIVGIEVPNYVKVGEYASEVTLPENDTLTQPNLTANVNGNEVDLSWNKVNGANNYRVFTKNHDKWQHLADTSANNCKYTPEDINEGGSFAVCCLNDTRNEYTSSIAQTQIEGQYPLPELKNVDAWCENRYRFTKKEGTQTVLQLVRYDGDLFICWSRNEDTRLMRYCVEMTDNSNGNVTLFYTTNTQSDRYITLYDYDLKEGVTYTFRVWGTGDNNKQVTPASESFDVVYHNEKATNTKVYNEPRAADTSLEDFEPYEEELEALELINAHRVANGLHELEFDKELCRYARIKVEDTVENDYYGHDSPVYGGVSSLIAGKPIGNYERFGGELCNENFVGGCATAKAAVDSWIGSQMGHNANLLTKNCELAGIGYHKDSGRWVFIAAHDKNVPYKYTVSATPVD